MMKQCFKSIVIVINVLVLLYFPADFFLGNAFKVYHCFREPGNVYSTWFDPASQHNIVQGTIYIHIIPSGWLNNFVIPDVGTTGSRTTEVKQNKTFPLKSITKTSVRLFYSLLKYFKRKVQKLLSSKQQLLSTKWLFI